MEPQKKKNRNKWLELISLPIQMGIIIYGFAWFGGWLDENHPHEKIDYRILLILAGVAVAMTNVIVQVNRMSRNS